MTMPLRSPDRQIPARLADQHALLFDLDGVLTPTAQVHMRAWSRLFTPYLAAHGVTPYVEEDYYAYIDGKPRGDGTRSLLASRGIQLPEGTPADAPELDTVYGLGNRKNAAFVAELDEHGVRPFPGSLAFLTEAIAAGTTVAVVSSSKNARQVLAAAQMRHLFSVIIDGTAACESGLAGKPAPDTYLKAAERLGLPAAQCVVLEDATSGVQAGAAGHFGLVIGVDRGAGAQALRHHGAHEVVRDLAELIPQLPRRTGQGPAATPALDATDHAGTASAGGAGGTAEAHACGRAPIA